VISYNFEKLLEDYGIDHKPMNSRGYIPVNCCLCDDDGFKGGFNSERGTYYCWRSGSHPLPDVIKILTGQDWRDIYLQYKTDLSPRDLYIMQNSSAAPRPAKLSLPEFTEPLNDRARKYLESRNFDSYKLEELYDLKSTGIHGRYNFRVIIPIYFENRLVSFSSRDYTGKNELRYFSCPEKDELICHKDVLYGYDLVPTTHVIACEGPADKWKMGVDSVATFGIGFKQNQINLLSTFSKITLLYDSGDTARKKCDLLGNQLAGLGCEVDAIYLKEGDPGDLTMDEANSLVKDIMGGQK